jgi:hypothetical protein
MSALQRIILIGLVSLAPLHAATRLPRSADKILVWADQLNTAPGSPNFRFVATHFVGTQKIDKARIDAYRELNDSFVVVQYHKAYGVDRGQNVTEAQSPHWNTDLEYMRRFAQQNPQLGTFESYFLHRQNNLDSTYRIGHLWNGNHEYDLADLRHSGFRSYVATETTRRCEELGFDGTFFDAAYFPSYGYQPADWFLSPPFSAASITQFGEPWNTTFAIPYWNYLLQHYHSGGRNQLLIINCDQMVTGWYQDRYVEHSDGGMVEGFFTYGGKLVGDDWRLSAGRIVQYLTGSGANRIMIAQLTTEAHNSDVRRWCIGNFLLLRNDRSYYYIVNGSEPYWYPEYELSLGSFVSVPSALSDLQVPGSSALYHRRYTNGVVVVNPRADSTSYTLDAEYRLVDFSGGGAVVNGSAAPMALSYSALVSGVLRVPGHSVLILKKHENAQSVKPLPSLDRHYEVNPQKGLYDLRGRHLKGPPSTGLALKRTTTTSHTLIFVK